MTNIFIDIESIPEQPEEEAKAEIAKTIQAPGTMKKQETIDDWHSGAGKYAGVKDAAIEMAYRKTALDGSSGQIVSYVFHCNNEFKLCHRDYKKDSEREILINMFEEISDSIRNHGSTTPVFFIGHNVAWDLKFLWHRAVILGVKPDFELPFSGRHGKDFFDNMQAWAGYNNRISQDNLCKALGIEGKPDDINGSQVWDFVKRGDIERVAEYNVDDVKKCIQIYNRINFIGA